MTRLWTVVAVCLLLSLSGCIATGPGSTVGTTAGADGVDGPAWSVTVTRVVDGDTVEVRYENGSLETVRLLGIDTPEVRSENDPTEFEGVPNTTDGRAWLDERGDEASEFVRERLDGERVTLQADSTADRRGSYGRLLGYVYHDGTDVNELLLERGHARVYPSQFSKRDRYESVTADAMARGVGIWGYADEPKNEVDGLAIDSINYDADGDDNENPNGEFVVFLNQADQRLNLTDYRVHDEAGKEYVFPDGVTLAPGESVVLRSGSGTDGEGTLYWGNSRPIWNNDGDTVTILAPNGTVVAEQPY